METIIKRKLREANVFYDVLYLEQRERNGYNNNEKKNVHDFTFGVSPYGYNTLKCICK